MKTLTAFAFVLALISWVATWIGLSGTWVGDDWEAVGASRMPRRLGTSGLRRDRDVVGADGIGTKRLGAGAVRGVDAELDLTRTVANVDRILESDVCRVRAFQGPFWTLLGFIVFEATPERAQGEPQG
jgi:hypothetical protein